MAFVIKKRCICCLKVLDENGNCTNPACPMSKLDVDNGDATETAEKAGTDE